MSGGKFPFEKITKVILEQVKQIIAPRYVIYPETTESKQIESAKKTYEFKIELF